ncbi:hypothetical protein E2C06_17860 [Dankookia rubra]|uniref:Uncharacterized protein n=1 Tax=Dankookia rubra TaxID=1442381 RepID=A0A4R5QE38_9PROT|nr:hypothetical protein [Dankookia rubra]TDH61236.1 hypothetical protein E2C06_17860 [Dankookia rubra]
MRRIIYVLSLAFFGALVFLGIPFLLMMVIAVLSVGWVAAFGLVAGTFSLVAGMLLHEPAAFRGALFLLGVGVIAFVILTLTGGAWHTMRARLQRGRPAYRQARPLRISLRQERDASFFDNRRGARR